jgi:hypothetical protein
MGWGCTRAGSAAVRVGLDRHQLRDLGQLIDSLNDTRIRRRSMPHR